MSAENAVDGRVVSQGSEGGSRWRWAPTVVLAVLAFWQVVRIVQLVRDQAPPDAFLFLFRAVLTFVLATGAVLTWRGEREWQVRHEPDPPQIEPPGPNRALSGAEEPPTRW